MATVAELEALRDAFELMHARAEVAESIRGLSPVGMPYYRYEGTAGEPLVVDIDEARAVEFPGDAVSVLQQAAGEAVGHLTGRIDPHMLRNELLRSAAESFIGGTSMKEAFDRVVGRTWRAIVAVPVGGAYFEDGPRRFGSRLVIGHLDASTEQAISDLAVEWHASLGGFRFNDEAAWTEDFLAAEEDPDFAEELDERLTEEQGWLPLVVAVALESAGMNAEVEAVSTAQAVCGALHVLARHTSGRSDVDVPWIMGLDGPDVAYAIDDDWGPGAAPLRIDSTRRNPGSPTVSQVRSVRTAVDVGAIINAGLADKITRVAEAATSGINSRGRVARACQLLRDTARTPPTFGAISAAVLAASIVKPGWNPGVDAIATNWDLKDAWQSFDAAVDTVTSAVLDLE